MIEALPQLQQKTEKGVRCLACRRYCDLPDGVCGYCSGYKNDSGKLIDLTYGRITSAQITELGHAPVMHYANQSDEILSVGTRGCNMGCVHCINYEHAFARHEETGGEIIQPQQLVDYAVQSNCRGIAANFNEGLLAVQYWEDIFKKAHENGLYTIGVTNGLSTPEALNIICPHLDVYRCDIKAISAEAMKKQGNTIDPRQVLDSIKYVNTKFPTTHIETVTLLVPGVNDSEVELANIANWIRENIGPDTPWNISPIQPIQTKKKITNPPPYLNNTHLFKNGNVVGASIRFTDNGVFLESGRFDLIAFDEPEIDLDLLNRAKAIGEAARLTNVSIKTDGR